jgi:uncharacterized protein
VIGVARLRNVTLDRVVAERVERARSVWKRMVGLLSYGSVAPDLGLWFDRCSSIHTLGMRATIDVIFLDANSRVIDIRAGIRPNQLLVWNFRAKSLIELGSAPLERLDLRIGDQLALEN